MKFSFAEHVLTVPSYPVTAMRYGIEKFGPPFWQPSKKPDLAVSGPNNGHNLDLVAYMSGTVGTAVEAARKGVPAIAFSLSRMPGDPKAFHKKTRYWNLIYLNLAEKVVQTIADQGYPYLPNNTWLNVNLHAVGGYGECEEMRKYQFVLTRMHPAIPFVTGPDAETCENGGRLPTESLLMESNGCYVSISVGEADHKDDASLEEQDTVLRKLESILSCPAMD